MKIPEVALFVLLLCWLSLGIANGDVIYEAEAATLVGPVPANNEPNYTGTGYVEFVNDSVDYIEWSVNASTARAAKLSFRYALDSGSRPLRFQLNGQTVVQQFPFPATGSFSAWAYTLEVTVNLNAGSNAVRLTAIGSSGANVDHLRLDWVQNFPPAVDAGQDLTIRVPREYMMLTGSVIDDEKGDPDGFLESTWSQVSGPAAEFITDVNELDVNVHLAEVGDYEFQLSATDGELSSFDTVMIIYTDPLCPVGDADGDCIVNMVDLGVVGLDWLDNTGTSIADLDGDGWVRMKELSLLSQSWLLDWTGSLQVTISPAEAVAAGAQWRISDNPNRCSSRSSRD